MASAPAESADSLVVGGWTLPADTQTNSDRYLARRLEAAGADFKGVAFTTFLLAAAVGVVAWLGLGVLAEHWLVPGGLSRGARWAWLAGAVLALAAAAVRWLLPLLRYRVNLVYAARAIEREHPDLHNDLVNTVLVKARPEGSAAVIVRSLEKRAAKRLADVPLEGVIDRTLAVRLAMVLAALVAAVCLYELAAPKSLLVSAARLVAPWAGIAAPSRVRIEAPRLHWRMPGDAVDPRTVEGLAEERKVAVERGSATLVRGRQLVVGAGIRGLRSGEKAVIHAVPLRDDGSPDPSSPAWQAEMTRGAAGAEEGKAFTVFLPDAARGVEGSVEIRIVAGDARGEPLRILVVDAPTLIVREVRYDYPAYLGREPETVAWQGDLRAPEETQVTLVAECNQPLEAAWIDFGCDGQRDLRMRVSANDLARAVVTFPLRMNGDRSAPEHATYRLLFQPRGSAQGGRDGVFVEPMEHRIEVLADLAPEVQILAPVESPLAVPLDAPVPVEVRALDPDHALAKVVLEARIEGGATTTIPVLDAPREGPFKGKGRIRPGTIPGARGGAVIQYRAVATDNRPQQPNVAVTAWQELTLDEAAAPPRDEPEPDLPNDARRPPPNGKAGRGDEARDGGGDDPPPDGGDRDPREGGDGRESDDGADGGGDVSGDQQRDGQRDQRDQGEGDASRSPDQERRQGAASADDPSREGEAPGEQGDAADGANPDGENKQPGQGNDAQPRDGASGRNERPGEGGKPNQGAGPSTRPGDRGEQGDGQGENRDGQGNAGQSARPDGDRQQPGNGGRNQGPRRPGERSEKGDGQSRGDGSRDPVASDGTNDGEAMERILEHRRRDEGEKGATEKGATEKGAGEKGAGEKGAGEKGAGEKGAGEKGAGEKGAGEKGATEKGAGEKGAGEKGAGEKGATEKGAGEKGAGEQGAGEQGAGEQGAGEQGAGEQGAGEQGAGEQGAGEKGAGEKGAGEKGAGQAAGGAEGAAARQGEVGQGGQPTDEQGPADPGAGAEDGDREGAGGADPTTPPSGQPGTSSSPTGSGGWSNGEGPPPRAGKALEGDAPSGETEWGDQDTRHARNAADLAVRTLKDDLANGRDELLDELGWTRDQARAFLERWERMKVLEGSADPARRGEYDRAVRSLGLRGEGARNRRDVPADVKGGQAEGRRTKPPADYLEQFKAYTQGTSGR